jgi:hypothetical protein
MLNAYERSLLNAVARARLNGETGLAAHAEAKLKRVMGTARAVAALARLNGAPAKAKAKVKPPPEPDPDDTDDDDDDDDDDDEDPDDEEEEKPMKVKKRVDAMPKSKTYGAGACTLTVEPPDFGEPVHVHVLQAKPTARERVIAATGIPQGLAMHLTDSEILAVAPAASAMKRRARK